MMWVRKGRGVEAVWRCAVVLLDDVGAEGEGGGGSMAVRSCP